MVRPVRSVLVFGSLAAGFLALAPLAVDPYLLHILILVLMSAVMALSWDLLVRTGQLSLAHAGFFGLGAYASALSCNLLGASWWMSFIAAGMAGGAAALALGIITLRLHGMYFAIATLAFAEVLRTVTLQAKFTGGAVGVTLPAIFGGNRVEAYYLVAVIFVLCLAVSLGLQKSRWGLAFQAIRARQAVAEVIGIDTVKTKLAAFVISSVFPSLMGAFYIHYVTYIIPYEAFSLNTSVSALVMSVFGGIYTTAGPVIGAVVLKILEEYLKSAIVYGYTVIYGLILALVILFMPNGLLGVIRRAAGSGRADQILRWFGGRKRAGVSD
ncbi:MAG: branched-chain amino acid ABC transporter permease [Peptococcaceae bacterium]|nr:branched-chain amino acid ABC transporter permease [Peptococcaceae bacterium]